MRLKQATTHQDDLSETLATNFVSTSSINDDVNDNNYNSDKQQQLEIDSFVNEFKQSRKLYHKRKIWSDKWSNGEIVLM